MSTSLNISSVNAVLTFDLRGLKPSVKDDLIKVLKSALDTANAINFCERISEQHGAKAEEARIANAQVIVDEAVAQAATEAAAQAAMRALEEFYPGQHLAPALPAPALPAPALPAPALPAPALPAPALPAPRNGRIVPRGTSARFSLREIKDERSPSLGTSPELRYARDILECRAVQGISIFGNMIIGHASAIFDEFADWKIDPTLILRSIRVAVTVIHFFEPSDPFSRMPFRVNQKISCAKALTKMLAGKNPGDVYRIAALVALVERFLGPDDPMCCFMRRNSGIRKTFEEFNAKCIYMVSWSKSVEENSGHIAAIAAAPLPQR